MELTKEKKFIFLKILNNFNYRIFLLISLFPLFISQVEVHITAKSGIVNKEIDSTKTIISFEIECEVDKNISNNMTILGINIAVKKLDDANAVNAKCNLAAVRLINVLAESTKLHCIINLTESNPSFGVEDDLIVESWSSIGATNPAATFSFYNFEQIKQVININGLTLEYLNDGYCKNNNFLFKITSTLNPNPLLSTICYINLDGDTNHKKARCAIPLNGNTITCNVDVSQKKYNQNDKISIKIQDNVFCENGQMIKISEDATNELTIKEECGEIINNNNKYLYYNYIFFIILFFILI